MSNHAIGMRPCDVLYSADPDVGQPYRRAYGRTQIVPYGRSRGATVPVKPATLAAIFARAVTVERLRSATTLGTVTWAPCPDLGPAPRAPSVPIANENRLVVPDTLGTPARSQRPPLRSDAWPLAWGPSRY
jgi:hypothetical protein